GCYNNKYWVAANSRSPYYIIAAADEPNEDLSQWSCTLFEPFPVDDDTIYSISPRSAGALFNRSNLECCKTRLPKSKTQHPFLLRPLDPGIPVPAVRVQRPWRSDGWERDDTTTDNSDTLFSPIKVGDNVIALRNLGNANFCKRLTIEGKTEPLA
ncbi:hypothetical protein C3L33_22053, partial [Rhododendron williamsianum]